MEPVNCDHMVDAREEVWRQPPRTDRPGTCATGRRWRFPPAAPVRSASSRVLPDDDGECQTHSVPPWICPLPAKPSKAALRSRLVHYMFSPTSRIDFFPMSPSWPTRSSLRRNSAKPKTFAPRSVHAMGTSFRPRVICSTCSSRKMLCRNGNAGRRSCCGPKVYTALALRRVATKPPSLKSFARHCAAPSGFGSPPIAIAKVSSSVRKFSSITITAAR